MFEYKQQNIPLDEEHAVNCTHSHARRCLLTTGAKSIPTKHGYILFRRPKWTS